MTGDLYINGTDAETLGVAMGNNFISAILTPAKLKDFVTNEVRTRPGKQYLIHNPVVAEREMTLSFVIFGDTAEQTTTRFKSFMQILNTGQLTIRVPTLGTEVYHLVYSGSGITYGIDLLRTTMTFSGKFVEPDPTART